MVGGVQMFIYAETNSDILIKCDKCGDMFKRSKDNVKYIAYDMFELKEPVTCKCGAVSSTSIYKKRITSGFSKFTTSRKHSYVPLFIIIGIILAIFIISKSGVLNNPSQDAYICAKHAVEEKLKDPSSARFSSYTDSRVVDLGNNEFEVNGTVRASNSFGAKIESNFSVTLTLTDQGYKNASVYIS